MFDNDCSATVVKVSKEEGEEDKEEDEEDGKEEGIIMFGSFCCSKEFDLDLEEESRDEVMEFDLDWR